MAKFIFGLLFSADKAAWTWIVTQCVKMGAIFGTGAWTGAFIWLLIAWYGSYRVVEIATNTSEKKEGASK